MTKDERSIRLERIRRSLDNPGDTPPEVERLYRQMLMSRSNEERMNMGFSMFRAAMAIMQSAILEEKPGISQKELKKEIFLRLYRDDFDEETREKILRHLDNLQEKGI